MKKALIYLKRFSIFIGSLIILSLIMSFLNLIGISRFATSFIMFAFEVILFFVYGFIHGKHTDNKGFVMGLKIGVSMILILFILSFIFYDYKYSMSILVFYLTLLLATIFGAISGKNKKEINVNSQ